MPDTVILYHGTSARNRRSIERHGIRKFSWFSTDIEDAKDFGEVSVGLNPGLVDIWRIEITEAELARSSWGLGVKRGRFYKFYRKPTQKPERVETYEWDVSVMSQRSGKIATGIPVAALVE